MNILITDEIKEKCPNISLGVLYYRADVKKSSDKLLEIFDIAVKEIENNYELSEIAAIPNIKNTREAYKALGKPPQGYRNSAEAMLRRIAKKRGLYHINNVVDINNLISIMSGYSLGSYDTDAIFGDVELRRATFGERYDGIGKDSVNIEHLPVLYDQKGPFGNPTSDSTRAMINPGKRNIMSIIYSFDGKGLEGWMDRYNVLLREFCYCGDIKVHIIK